jgi:hypothetical protein
MQKFRKSLQKFRKRALRHTRDRSMLSMTVEGHQRQYMNARNSLAALSQRDQTRRAEIARRLEELRLEARQLDARVTAQERALRTRQAVIVGGWLRAHEPHTFNRVVSALVRPQDRMAFGLDGQSTQQQTHGDVAGDPQ